MTQTLFAGGTLFDGTGAPAAEADVVVEDGRILEQAVQMMAEGGTWLVPTLVAPQGVIDAAEAGAQIPEASLQKARDVVAAHAESFRLAVEAGVNIAMGTDSARHPPGAEPSRARPHGCRRIVTRAGAGRHHEERGGAHGAS
jgi:imidazolonepropionase-like amidohydrolase